MNFLNRLKVFIIDLLLYAKVAFRKPHEYSDNKTPILQINLTNPQIYTRYLYVLLKQFQICSYHIYIPVKFRQFRKISSYCKYLSMLIEEDFVFFKHAPSNCIPHILNDDSISPDYFTSLLKDYPNSRENNLHISMPFHPLMYKKGLWNAPLSQKNHRKKSIFMCGNFDQKAYANLNKNFKSIPRIEVYKFLSNKKLLFSVKTQKELDDFVNSEEDHKCIIVKSSDFTVSMKNLRNTLHQFTFFLALPGTVMPHCHNIVEALSAGLIPIIHEEYANLLVPSLQHMENALTYNSLSELSNRINDAYKLSENQIKYMQKNAFLYYNKNMTPQATVQNIELNTDKKLLLIAEHHSMKFLD